MKKIIIINLSVMILNALFITWVFHESKPIGHDYNILFLSAIIWSFILVFYIPDIDITK